MITNLFQSGARRARGRGACWRRALTSCAAGATLLAVAACGGGGSGGGGDAAPSGNVTPASAQALSLLAGQLGGGRGYADGPRAYAAFQWPAGMVADASGNVDVADPDNHVVRKILPDGTVTTLAGTGQAGYQDGPADQAQFDSPMDVAVDGNGNVYVTDLGNHRIRKITPQGQVSTLAGSGASGQVNGSGQVAQFAAPWGIASDASGNLYVTDDDLIRKVTPDGTVSTWAGSTSGQLDGPASSAKFRGVTLLRWGPDGKFYVAECSKNHDVRTISPSGEVSTVTGLPTDPSTFGCAEGLAWDPQGRMYVSDPYNDRIWVLDKGQASVFAGLDEPGDVDGVGVAARFDQPFGLLWSGDHLLVADAGNGLIKQITSGAAVSLFAGTREAQLGSNDGLGAAARFQGAQGVTVDSQGNVFVADCDNNAIRKITPAGQVSTWVGQKEAGFADGTGASAKLDCPLHLTMDPNDNLYFIDQGNQAIRKVSVGGVVTTLARSNALAGPGSAGLISQVDGLAVDKQGNVYASDAAHDTVLKLTADGTGVSLLAGKVGQAGQADGQGSSARFNSPQGLVIDAQGNLFVADFGNQRIRKVTAAGVVSTVAGSGATGSDDGAAASATFNQPFALALDEAGNLYVAEANVNLVRKVSPDGVVSTLLGQRGRQGFVPGDLPGVIQQPIGLWARAGKLCVSMGAEFWRGSGVAQVKLPK